MKKIILTVLNMQGIGVPAMGKAEELLNKHAADVSAELHPGAVQIIPSKENPEFVTIKTTATKEEWERYNAGKRPELREWFIQNILKQGYATIAQTLEIDI